MIRYLFLASCIPLLFACNKRSTASDSPDKKSVNLKIDFTGDLAFLDVPAEEFNLFAHGYKDGEKLEQEGIDGRGKPASEYQNTSLNSETYYSYIDFVVPAGADVFKLVYEKTLGMDCTLTPSEGPIEYNDDGSVVENLSVDKIDTECSDPHYPVSGIAKGNTSELTIRLTGPAESTSELVIPVPETDEGESFSFEGIEWNWDQIESTKFSDVDYEDTNLEDRFLQYDSRNYGDYTPKGLRSKIEIVQKGDDDLCEITNNSDLIAGELRISAGGNILGDLYVRWVKAYGNVEILCASRDKHSISGTISGHTSGFEISVGEEKLSVGASDKSFSVERYGGADYKVTVMKQPTNQICSVSNAEIKGLSKDVDNVEITCSTNAYSLGGTVSGLGSGTLVLNVNTGEDLSITANGSYKFPKVLASDTSYSVSVKTQPADFHCTVSDGTGSITANVTNVNVACIAKKYIYVASATAGNFGGPSGADTLCDNEKPKAGTWKAMISDNSTRLACSNGADCTNSNIGQADWVLSANTMYRRSADDAYIGTTNSVGVFPFPLSNGWTTVGDKVWTGLEMQWQSSTDNCTAWTSGSNMINGKAGIDDATNNTAIGAGGIQDCDPSNTHALVCVQQ